jgi:hypothetical protein
MYSEYLLLVADAGNARSNFLKIKEEVLIAYDSYNDNSIANIKTYLF